MTAWKLVRAAVCLALLVASRASAQSPRTWLEDAELTDVQFANPQEGWAVGDRGVVWHTNDGGRAWKLQRTDTPFRLEGVAFANAQQGWIVGEERFAYAPGSRGILLSTNDGGVNWRKEETSLLGGLRGIQAFTTQHIRAWGSRSSIFPNSFYWTADGGRGWNPFSGELADDYNDAAFSAPQSGAAITRRGAVLSISDRAARPARHPDAGLRELQCVRWSDELRGVIVGDGGLIWLTRDGGQSWSSPTNSNAAGIDFRAVAARGANIWATGSPGTVVWHSPDFGANWQRLPTGHSTPLNALTFIDADHGWAVGALGAILATSDGGKSWKLQRAGGKRAGVFGIFADAESTPWELFAQTCGQEGALGAAHFVVRRDWLRPEAESRDATGYLQRGMSAVGGCYAERSWRFPVEARDARPDAASMVELWNDLHDGQGLEQLERDLVRRIRMWRPEVIFTHAAPPRGDDPLPYLLNQAVLRAAERAAAEDYRAAEMADLALPPWKVKKIYGAMPPGQTGGELVATTQLAPELGCSLGQQAGLARAMACERPQSSGGVLGFQLMASQMPESASGRGFLGGLNLPVGGDGRRAAIVLRDRGGEQLRELAVRQRNVQAILMQIEGEKEARTVMAQLPEMIRVLGAEHAAPLLLDLATRARSAGRIDDAAELNGLLVERYPDHPLAAPAMVWLLQYWSSGEQQHRANRSASASLAKTSRTGQVVDLGDGVQLTGFEAPNAAPATVAADQTRAGRASRLQALSKLLSNKRPTLAAEPAVVFPLAAFDRNASTDGQQSLRMLPRTRAADAWRQAVDAEIWKSKESTSECPKATWHCRRTSARPVLDGVLDDATWENADDIELISVGEDAETNPTTIVAAHDDQFLYLAIAGAKSPRCKYAEGDAKAARDADCSDADRVEFSIDIDRDYVTAWQFAVDCQGRARDACWGDSSWNPRWHVAARHTESAWFVEVAIPLAELSAAAPIATNPWAVAVRRVSPGAGTQGWAAPVPGETSLEDAGWLVFE